ncbi:hypothetical protein ACSL103130_08790 [Actinomyces slackii]|uniref:Uncharacterized protein n=1 Tax=Actinomyces slackii TaxID=52774 RepID=A0A3S4TBW4_9ACTO|nr:hypothetical protein [Actinomyces slackii]VEG74325.1 Uncharacterised protein [Actinomyces slackii]
MSQAVRYEPRHISRFRRPALRTYNGVAALGVACLVAGVLAWAQWPPPATVGALTVIVFITLGLVTAPPTSALRQGVMARGARRGWAATMLLAMSPAILLGLTFPVVAGRIAERSIDGVPLQSIILSVSVAVPWISQVAGNPVYRLLGDTLGRGPGPVMRKYCSLWPVLFLWALLPTLMVVLAVATVTGWGLGALSAHVCLLLAHVVFIQSLIVADISGHRRLWAMGWLVYALALLVVPAWWILPPVLGAASQMLAMGRPLAAILRPSSAPAGVLVQDMARGLILGGVLWSDKLFLFLAAGKDFEVAVVYLGLQPAVVAYCYYFAVTSPRVNTEVAVFQALLDEEDMDRLRARGQVLRRMLDASLGRAVAVGVGGLLICVVVVALVMPEQTLVILTVGVSSLLFSVLTLLAYEIDHIGDQTSAMLLSGIHVAVSAALILSHGSADAYLPLAGVDLVLCLVGLVLYRRRWAAPEYSFFWGKAMSW